jgi:hypothetical protein
LQSDPGERVNLADITEYASVLEAFRERTQVRSSELTSRGRQYKAALPVDVRPEEDVYCW